MTDTLSTFAGTIWEWLNAEQNAGALSAVLAVLTLAGGAGGWLWQRKSKAPASDQAGGNHVSASTGGVGAGGSMTGNTITTNHGATPEQIAAIIAGVVLDLSKTSEEKAIAAADKFGTISREALTSFFTILRQQPPPPEQLTAKLTAIAQRHQVMLDRFATLEQAAKPDDHPALTEARVAVEKGDYDRAAYILTGIEEEQTGLRAKAQAKADEHARQQAATRADRARISALCFNHLAAADHFLAAANFLPAGNTEDRSKCLTDSADALVDYGEKQGDNNALLLAIARYREALPPRHCHPNLWASVQNSLGTTFTILSKHEVNEKGCALLGEAVDAYKNALLERTREDNPIDWAQTQGNLGNAYLSIGKLKDDKEFMWKGVGCLKDTLLVYTQENSPIEWARTQNNLGCAFQIIGQNEIKDNSILRSAANFYMNAMMEWTQDRAPIKWAIAQTNLGMVFRVLGEREGDSTLLRKAINAYNSALFVRTRDRTPIDWADTQINLSNALQILAKLTCDIDAAKQAIAAQEAALEMFTYLKIPTRITIATNNLAGARATLAELENGAALPPHQ